jgi:hypothetical protein
LYKLKRIINPGDRGDEEEGCQDNDSQDGVHFSSPGSTIRHYPPEETAGRESKAILAYIQSTVKRGIKPKQLNRRWIALGRRMTKETVPVSFI